MICSFFQVHCTCLHFLCWSRTNKIKISLVRKTLDNIEVWALGVKYQIIGFDISWWANNWECKNIVTNFVPLLVVEFFFSSLSLSLAFSSIIRFSSHFFFFVQQFEQFSMFTGCHAMPVAPIFYIPRSFPKINYNKHTTMYGTFATYCTN